MRLFLLLLAAASTVSPWEALRRDDARLAGVAYRLVTANAALCPRRAPASGLVLHALAQYPVDRRGAARAAFGFATPVAVEAVVPGSPAAAAGVRADDALVAVAGRRLAGGGAGVADRDAALALIAAGPAGEPVALTVRRGEGERVVTLAPVVACDAMVELAGGGLTARADGRAIQLGDAFLQRFGDAEVAVVVAHELAHLVRGDRAAPGGRASAAADRVAEDAADALSVALLYNAGFDPGSAAAFWRRHGAMLAAAPFARRRHGTAAERAAALDRAAAAIPEDAVRPFRPAQ